MLRTTNEHQRLASGEGGAAKRLLSSIKGSNRKLHVRTNLKGAGPKLKVVDPRIKAPDPQLKGSDHKRRLGPKPKGLPMNLKPPNQTQRFGSATPKLQVAARTSSLWRPPQGQKLRKSKNTPWAEVTQGGGLGNFSRCKKDLGETT